MVVEVLGMVTSGSSLEVVMAIILEIMTSNLLTMVQREMEALELAGTRSPHTVEEMMAQEAVEDVGVMEGEVHIELLPVCPGLHCLNSRE